MDNIPDRIFFKDPNTLHPHQPRHAQALGLTDPAAATGRSERDFRSAEQAAAVDAEDRQLLQQMKRSSQGGFDGASRRWFSSVRCRSRA